MKYLNASASLMKTFLRGLATTLLVLWAVLGWTAAALFFIASQWPSSEPGRLLVRVIGG